MVSYMPQAKQYFIVISAIALSACSSSPKQEVPVAKPTSVVTSGSGTAPSQTANTPARPAAPAPAVTPAPTLAVQPPAAPAPAAAAPAVATPSSLAPPVATSLKAETGLYRCEEKQTVAVKRIIDGGKKIVLAFAGKDHELSSVASDTGALRYENKQAGYTWIQLANTALLLDTKKGQRVANQCKL